MKTINKRKMYISDREFTDYVHKNLAVHVYNQLNWVENMDYDKKDKVYLDNNKGIDYIYNTPKGNTVGVQERFREITYINYDDFTIRFERPYSNNPNSFKSEFYKIKADLMLYGVINTTKDKVKDGPISFKKLILINYKLFREMIKEDKFNVYVDYDAKYKTSFFNKKTNTLYLPVLHNRDKSSTFVPISIKSLAYINKDLIIYHKVF